MPTTRKRAEKTGFHCECDILLWSNPLEVQTFLRLFMRPWDAQVGPVITKVHGPLWRDTWKWELLWSCEIVVMMWGLTLWSFNPVIDSIGLGTPSTHWLNLEQGLAPWKQQGIPASHAGLKKKQPFQCFAWAFNKGFEGSGCHKNNSRC